ncbi:MAG: DUF2313 domain-containing protein [Oscillospiraceae bacterium]|nr:DUF2313 domain-containing protein [Oscillospiraceae bacterium]
MMFYKTKAEPIKLLPDILAETKEMQAICKALGGVLDEMNELIAKSADNSFIKIADQEGVSRWEKILGVSAPLNSVLQSRREALLARLISKPPINLAVLKNIIETYMGVEVDIETEGYFVNVSYRGEAKISDLRPLFATAYELIPAVMLLEIGYRYLIWREMDGISISFDDLDGKNLTWQLFEKGEWTNG